MDLGNAVTHHGAMRYRRNPPVRWARVLGYADQDPSGSG